MGEWAAIPEKTRHFSMGASRNMGAVMPFQKMCFFDDFMK